MDIHLQPHFYLVVADFIKAGYDTIDIHRRTIPQYSPLVRELPAMLAEPGIHHGGMDCIVFPRNKYGAFVKNHACVGMSLVMKAVLLNCALQAKRFLVLSNAHLTFHIGNERAWAIPLYREYEQFNLAECHRVISAVSQDSSQAVRLISAVKAMAVSETFVLFVEDAAGIKSRKPTLRQMIGRKVAGARSRLARKAIDLISRFGGDVPEAGER